MKVKKQVEVTVCDVCGADGEIHSCCCGRDVCDSHYYQLTDNDRYIGRICRTHIDPEILKKLGD